MDSLFVAAVKACVQTKTGREVRPPAIALKATRFDDAEGIIHAKVSVADVRDRENERVTESALKAAVYELAMRTRAVAVDLCHDAEPILCDIVGTWYGDPMPDPKAGYVALRPHDRAIYDAAKAGEIVGMSWSGPYRLEEDDETE